ncbi:MAG: RsmE family RNA methyltransferase [Kofleriaceae bacterium]
MRIFVDPARLVAGELAVAGDEHHYLGRVRRARVGDRVELCDGAGRRANATILRISDAQTLLAVEPPQDIAARPPLIRVLVPLIKGDRMDSCLEKLVEVGADAIVVWPAARSVVRLDDARRDARLAKYRAAMQAAARQCGRAQVPSIELAPDLATAIMGVTGVRIVLDPASDAVIEAGDATDVTIASGPEGGLASDELARLAAFTAAGLGPRILRAETAPVVAVALIRAATRS